MLVKTIMIKTIQSLNRQQSLPQSEAPQSHGKSVGGYYYTHLLIMTDFSIIPEITGTMRLCSFMTERRMKGRSRWTWPGYTLACYKQRLPLNIRWIICLYRHKKNYLLIDKLIYSYK